MESSLLPISGNTGLNVNVLFPLDPLRILASFTASPPTSTVPSSLSTRLEHVSLSDNALGIHKVSSRTSHFLVVPPEYHHTEYPSDASLELDFDHKYCSQDARCKELAWEASFPQGSINPSNRAAPAGGFGFYLRGTETFAAQLKDAEEVLMSYEMMFEEGWMWGKGGKLPGICAHMFPLFLVLNKNFDEWRVTDGGVGDEAYGCTGGRTKERCKCFDLRLMWRSVILQATPRVIYSTTVARSDLPTAHTSPTHPHSNRRSDGLGELYAYLAPTEPNVSRLLNVQPRSLQNPDYGFSVGRGAWTFEAGRWTAIAQRVRMNMVGKEDGAHLSHSLVPLWKLSCIVYVFHR